MNFSLVLWPLSLEPDQKNHLCLDRFDISHRPLGWSVFVAPDVEVRLPQRVPPSITVVATLAHAVPTKP